MKPVCKVLVKDAVEKQRRALKDELFEELQSRLGASLEEDVYHHVKVRFEGLYDHLYKTFERDLKGLYDHLYKEFEGQFHELVHSGKCEVSDIIANGAREDGNDFSASQMY